MTHERLRLLAPLLYVALAGAYMAAELVVAGRLGPPLDDGWIYMAFARSVSLGEGMTYPGHEGSIASVTGPVWCGLLAAAFWLLGPAVWVTKTCGVVAALFALYGVHRLGRVATGDARVAAAAVALVAVTPRFHWGALSVMEVPFYVGAVALGLAWHLERRDRKSAAWLPSAILLLAAGWARPECFVFAVLAALHRRRARDLVAVVALLALYPVYHLWVWGHPLPTTFYAKAATTTPLAVLARDGFLSAVSATSRDAALELGAFAAYLPTFLPMLVPGFLAGVRRGLHERNGVPFVVVCLVVFVVARGVLGFSPPWFQHGRYFQHAFALFAIVCLHGMVWTRVSHGFALASLVPVVAAMALQPELAMLLAWDWRTSSPRVPIEQMALWIVWLPAAAFSLVALFGWWRARGAPVGRPPLWALVAWLGPAVVLGGVRHSWGVRDTYALNVAMAEQVRALVPAGELVACHDIGALGWFAERPLLDLAGLGSPEVVRGPRRADGTVDIARILAERRVRWVCLTDDMAHMINPSAGVLPGLAGAATRFEIHRPDNVTVAGSTYRLIELTWR
jgi:hypothetical protein